MLTEMGKHARQASRLLARADSKQKDAALTTIAEQLLEQSGVVLAANAQDVADSQKAGLSPALLDRLSLNPVRLEGIAADLRQTISLPDPVGETFESSVLPNGLQLSKQRVPLGVIGVIYESRPNVTIDVAGLALKSGNAVILRGGSESLRTNLAFVTLIRRTLEEQGLPADAVQFIDSPDRALVMGLLQLHEYVDILIPRGGAALHKFCRDNSRIPVITGGIGICHLFVDESAKLDAAIEVIYNAKTQRPSVCNALDTVLVHQAVAKDFLPRLVARLETGGVTFRVDEQAIGILQSGSGSGLPASVSLAGPDDFDTEWLSLVLGIKVVKGLVEAFAHIQAHSTAHSDGILTQDDRNAARFVAEVDSAAIYVNASTRFTDGGQFGLGGEVAISTQRLHARGPMGLRELTTYKWVVRGDYHVRA